MDHLFGSAHRDRHVDRRKHELRAQMVFHRPADDFAREDIQHDRQVQKPAPSGDIRRIGHPQSVGSIGVEAPLDQIRHLRGLRCAHGCHHKLAQRCSAQPRRSHQPGYALAPDTNAVLVGELRVDHRRTVGLARATMDIVNVRAQADVGPLPGRHRTFIPSIEAARGHSKQSAHDPYREVVAVFETRV